MLNLLHVQSFIAVVDASGFAEAGRRTGAAQPTISQHIRKLEDDLGAVLLRRDTRAVDLTQAGRAFLPFARSLLALAGRARHAVDGGLLAIGASSNIGIYMLPGLVSSFQAAHADSVIDLWIGTNQDVIRRVESRELDVGVVEWAPDGDGFLVDSWCREPLVVIVPPDHPWARHKTVPREALFDQPMIGGEAGTGTGRVLREALGPDADRIRIVRNLGSTEAVKQAVKSGLGVSLVLESSVREEVRHGTLRALKIRSVPLSKDLKLIRLPECPATDLAPAFMMHMGL